MPLEKQELVKKIGANIRKHRKTKSMSLQKLALESGIEYSQISRIERGIINTSVYHVYIISNTLGVPVKYIFQDL